VLDYAPVYLAVGLRLEISVLHQRSLRGIDGDISRLVDAALRRQSLSPLERTALLVQVVKSWHFF